MQILLCYHLFPFRFFMFLLYAPLLVFSYTLPYSQFQNIAHSSKYIAFGSNPCYYQEKVLAMFDFQTHINSPIAKESLTHYTEDANSVLSRGDMFIIPPESLHYITPGPDADFFTFSFQPDIFGETNHCNRLANHFLSNLTINKEIYPKITLPSDELLHTEGSRQILFISTQGLMYVHRPRSGSDP